MILQKLSIIIPTYNEKKNIYDLVKKILKVVKIKKLEIIVVDDDSTDVTDVVRTFFSIPQQLFESSSNFYIK